MPAPLQSATAQDFREVVPVPSTSQSLGQDTPQGETAPTTRPLSAYVVLASRPPKLACGWSGSESPLPAAARAYPVVARAFAAFETGDYEKSVAVVARKARSGDPAAGFALACVLDGLEQSRMSRPIRDEGSVDPLIFRIRRAYSAGLEVRPGLRSGLEWMRSVAESGFEPAQLEMAGQLDDPKSRSWGDAAAEWVARLAATGRADFVRRLGMLYLYGQGKPQDREEGVRLIRVAAGAGDPEAMLTLVGLIRRGVARPDGDDEAIRWLRRLSAGGDARAKYYLALALRESGSGEAALAEAASLLREVANQLPAAAYELAVWYRLGIGLHPEIAKAEALLEQAAVGGYRRAVVERTERQISLGLAAMSADRKKELESEVAAGGTDWLLSQGEDIDSGFALSRAERASWESRRQAARYALGTDYLDELIIRQAFLSGDRAREDAATAILFRFAGGEGGLYQETALAALAFPAVWIPPSVAERLESGRWRARIERLDPEKRARVRSQILSTPLSNQNFAAALQSSAEAGSEEALIGRFDTLNSMGLQAVAFRELLAYVPRARSNEIRDTLVRTTVACDWDRVTADWIARTQWDDDGCSGVHALRSLDSRQLEQLGLLGSISAPIFLALDKLEGRTARRDVPGARSLLEGSDPAYEEGQVAQGVLGMLAEEGVDGPPDLASAAFHYQRGLEDFDRKASEVWFPGNPAIAARLGRLLLEGRGVGKDLPKAIELLRFGAFSGVALADTAVGDSLWLGLGQPRDREEALRWYRNAAEYGDPVALVRFGLLARLGLWNERGLGADRWYELAAGSNEREALLELARAATLAPMTVDPASEVRGWLGRAESAGSGWARQWLAACAGEREVSCFSRQPDFFRNASRIASGAPRGRPPRRAMELDWRSAEERLASDVSLLMRRSDYVLRFGNEVSGDMEALDDLERVQIFHGDSEGLLRTSLRRQLVQDSFIGRDKGGLANYFALVESSCHWGEASQLAYRNGRKEAALFLAKIAVNHLQDARRFLSDLKGDLRECFIKAHEDRYRWLSGLLIESGRLAEAEAVITMLKDFEHSQYTGDRARRSSSFGGIDYSPAEATALATLERAAGALSVDIGNADAAVQPAESSRSFAEWLDTLVRQVRLLDDARPTSAGPSRDEWLTSIKGSIVSDMRELYGPDTVALHAVVLPDRIHWIISTAEGQSSRTIKVSQAELNSAITDFLVALHTGAPEVKAKALGLYRMTFEPIDWDLRRRGARNLLLSLDDRLRYLPFAALFDGEGWLVERYGLSSFRRPSDYRRKGPGGPLRLAGFGVSRGGNGLSELPGVARELDEIVRTGEGDRQGVVPGVVDLDEAFTRTAFSDALKADFRIVHIASHFVLNETSAADSFLLLGGGDRLPLLDFSAAGAFSFSNVDLVTLSACHTAMRSADGNGSEIDSMGTVAQDAGAPAVVASLWSVEDESTARLMQSFYRHRVNGNLSTASALQLAQVEMIREARTDPTKTLGDPRYWAPFIILGNAR